MIEWLLSLFGGIAALLLMHYLTGGFIAKPPWCRNKTGERTDD